MSGKKWTSEEDADLRELYADTRTKVIAEKLGRTESSTFQRARNLGLKKSAAYLKTEASGRLSGESSKAHRFPKGGAPWNKGMKGLNIGGEATRFKPGSRPHTWQPIGTEKLDKDGLLVRKVSDEGRRHERWKGLHVLTWEREKGLIPAGHIVVFKPGMKTNQADEITIDRLECISRAENMRRNSYHNYPPEIAKAIQLIGAVNRQINKRAKDGKQHR